MHIPNMRRVGAAHLVIVAGALLASAGCAEYDIEIICENQINAYGRSEGQAGNVLDVVFVCLKDSDMRDLARKGKLGKWDDLEEHDLLDLVTAEAWFDQGLKGKLESKIKPTAIFETRLRDGDVAVGQVIHPSPLGGKACIVALADFSNRAQAGDKKKHTFEAEVLRFTAWRGHRLVLHVGRTRIWWDSE